jgi:SAM-dependent methyltransferase
MSQGAADPTGPEVHLEVVALPPTPDYGYHAPGPMDEFEYVAGPVLDLCRALGGRRVLDLGCGNGEFCRRLAAAGFEAVGCDPSESGIRVARASVAGATFKQLGVYDPPADLDEPRFDLVVAVEVVEHLYLPRALPRFARAVLCDGGHLVLTTPYHGYAKNLLLSLLGRWDTHHDPLWDAGHIKFWSPQTLRRLVEPEGFDHVRFVGAGRLPFLWKSMVMAFQARPREQYPRDRARRLPAHEPSATPAPSPGRP